LHSARGAAAYALWVPLHRAILLTPDEETELLNLHRAFRAAQSPSHDSLQELEALQRLSTAETRIAAAHGLDPAMCQVGYGTRDYSTWRVHVEYPLSPEEERQVRGLG
jgi:hypothetical protein